MAKTEIDDTQIRPGTSNQILGTNAAATADEYKTLNGTTNEITVTNGVGSITLSTPLTSAIAYTLPSTRGTSGYFLQTDGSTANLVWAAGGSGSPAGSNGDVQFNNSGAFGADAGNFDYSSSTHSLTLAGKIKTGDGSAGAPSYTFTSDSTTGMYHDPAYNGGTALQFTLAGTLVLSLNSIGGIECEPKIDARGGIFVPGANVSIETAGAGNGLIFTDSGGYNPILLTYPAGGASAYNLILPPAQGAANTFLKNDGSGNLSWTAGGGVSSLNSLTGALSIVGTTNEITVTPSGTNITLSTPFTSAQALTFPAGTGTSGYVLSTNGSGTLSWIAGGSGTVNSGTQYQLAYYATSTTAVSGLTLITASRALVSDTNGLPVAATTTATEIGYVNGVTSAIQTQFTGKRANFSNGQLPGTATNDNATAGNVGEYIASVVSGGSPITLVTGVWTNFTSIALSAGDWEVTGLGSVNFGPVYTGNILLGLSLYSGSTYTDLAYGDNTAEFCYPLTASSTISSTSVPAWRVSAATAVTVYIKVFATFSAGTTPSAYGRVSARRMR